MKFLNHLADFILKEYGNDLRNTVIIFPNIRSKLFISKYLNELAKKTIWLPEMYSSAEFFQLLSGFRIEEDYMLLPTLFESVTDEIKESTSFSDFMGWALTLLSDFREIDRQLADAEKLFGELADIRRMEHWNPEMKEVSDEQSRYLKLCAALPGIYRKFNRLMAERSTSHSGFAERMAAEKIPEFALSEKRRYIIAGFNAMSNAEQKVFRTLAETGKAVVLFDYDTYYTDNVKHEAGLFARNNALLWKKNPLPWTGNYFSEIPKSIKICQCSNSVEQSYVTAEILSHLNPSESLDDVAVILPEESMLLPLLSHLPASIEKINITMGFSLVNSPYYALFDATIKLHYSLETMHRPGNGYYYKDVFRLIRSEGFSLLQADDGREKTEALIKEIHRYNLIFVDPEKLTVLLSHSALDSGISFNPDGDVGDLMSGMSAMIGIMDSVLRGQDRLADKIGREFLLHHLEVNQRLSQITGSLEGGIDFRTLHRIWNHYIKVTKVQFSGEPLSGLQIMGLLESRNLDFNHIIILNNNEGTLPSGRNDPSFIPYDLKKKYGLPIHREREAVFAYHFYRLLQRAKSAHLLYHVKSDGLYSGEISRFLIQLKRELPDANDAHSLEDLVCSAKSENKPQPAYLVNRSGFINEKIRERLEKGISPTALSAFINCPLDFYHKYIIGLREVDELTESAEADLLGTIIHQTLESLYRPFLNSEVSVHELKTIAEKAESELKFAFENYFESRYVFQGKNLLMFRTAENFMNRFFYWEKEKLSSGPVKIRHLEKEFLRRLKIAHDNEEINVLIKGKLDRVEIWQNRLNIVDYKSGMVAAKELKLREMGELFAGKKNKMLQLLLYLWMMADQEDPDHLPISAQIYSMRSYGQGYFDLNPEKSGGFQTTDFASFEDELKNFLKNLAFSENTLEHNQRSEYCNYC